MAHIDLQRYLTIVATRLPTGDVAIDSVFSVVMKRAKSGTAVLAFS